MKKHMQEITDKVRNGIRLNKEDGLFLYKRPICWMWDS